MYRWIAQMSGQPIYTLNYQPQILLIYWRATLRNIKLRLKTYQPK